MVQMGRDFEQFQRDVATEGSEEMVGLSVNRLSWRLFPGGILLQGFVKRFDAPPFAVDSCDLVAGESGYRWTPDIGCCQTRPGLRRLA